MFHNVQKDGRNEIYVQFLSYTKNRERERERERDVSIYIYTHQNLGLLNCTLEPVEIRSNPIKKTKTNTSQSQTANSQVEKRESESFTGILRYISLYGNF